MPASALSAAAEDPGNAARQLQRTRVSGAPYKQRLLLGGSRSSEQVLPSVLSALLEHGRHGLRIPEAGSHHLSTVEDVARTHLHALHALRECGLVE